MTISSILSDVTLFSYYDTNEVADGVIIGWVIGIVIWGLIWGFITKAVSSSKGYDGGFAWGFFLGLIGLIVVAVRPDNRPMTSYSGVTGKRCPHCGYLNSLANDYCLECGRKLSATIPRAEKAGSWKCSCGALNYDYETSCHRCGKTKSECLAKEKADKLKPATAEKSITEQLEELKKLQEQGLITEQDFEAKKKQILKI